jgi:hypothetical protein
MSKQELAILFSGSVDSLALYTLSAAGRHADIPRPRKIHLLCMQNGALRFKAFPFERFKTAEKTLKAQAPSTEPVSESSFVELDTAGLFQRLWLDQCEALMPQYNGKNLVCTACMLAMHTRAVIYCVERLVPVFIASCSGNQSCCPQQNETFVTKVMDFSYGFGITTRFPLNSDFDDEMVLKSLLEDYGLPANDGGERKCLFAQSLTTATAKEIESYLDAMLPHLNKYVDSRLEGKLRDAAECF